MTGAWGDDMIDLDRDDYDTDRPIVAEQQGGGWRRKFKGTDRGGAYIHTHPILERAIVENHNGISFHGQRFATLDAAKLAALAIRPTAAR